MANILLIVISNGFFFFITHGYYALYWNKYPKRRTLYVIGWIMLFIILNFAYYIFFREEGVGEIISMLGIAFILTFAAILLQVMERVSIMKEQIERYAIYQQNLYYAKQFQEISRNEEETRRQRHELINNYLAILSMANQNDKEGIIEFTNKQLKQVKKKSSIVNCGNMTIDSVLNYKLDPVKHIKLKLNINIPTKLELNQIVLCGVLGNALDNAIEACSHVKEEERFLQIDMRIEKKNLFLEIVNSFDGIVYTDNSGKLISGKKNKEKHGFGLIAVKKLLEEYNGNMNVDWDDKQFRFRSIIYQVI